MPEHHTNFYETHAEHVSAAELRHLKSHDPTITYRLADVEGISQGRQSRVSVLEYEHGGETFSVLWKRMGAGKGLAEAEADGLRQRLTPYRQALATAGWNLPKLLYTKVCEVSGEHQIFSYEQFIPGGDGEKMYADEHEPNFRKWYMMEEIIASLAGYPEGNVSRRPVAGKETTVLPHGLDLKPANYVLEQGTNDLYFIDLFGPKEIDNAGQWMSYSPKLDSLSAENLMAVCATREGTVLRCWRLAEQYWSNSGRSKDELRAEFIDRLYASALPSDEKDFIAREIQQNFPWLDTVYQERSV